MRKLVCLLGLVFLFCLSAAAQDVSKVDLFAGYSYLHAGPGIAVPSFNANGGVGSAALNLTKPILHLGAAIGGAVPGIARAEAPISSALFMLKLSVTITRAIEKLR